MSAEEQGMLGRHVYRVDQAADGGWTVAKEGEPQPRAAHRTREAAVASACDLASADEPSKVVVVNDDGTLFDERVFGADPGEVMEN